MILFHDALCEHSVGEKIGMGYNIFLRSCFYRLGYQPAA